MIVDPEAAAYGPVWLIPSREFDKRVSANKRGLRRFVASATSETRGDALGAPFGRSVGHPDTCRSGLAADLVLRGQGGGYNTSVPAVFKRGTEQLSRMMRGSLNARRPPSPTVYAGASWYRH